MTKKLSAGEVAAAWGDGGGQKVIQSEVVNSGAPVTRIAVPEQWVGVIVAATAQQAEQEGIGKGFQMGVASEQGKKPRTFTDAASGVVTRVVKQPLIDIVASIGQPAEDGGSWPTADEWSNAPGFLGPKVESETMRKVKKIGRRLLDLGAAAVANEFKARWGTNVDEKNGGEVTKKE